MLLIWRRWRGWRRGRPFWGGLLTVLAGAEIGVIPLAPMKVMLHQGTAGIPSVVLALIMVVLGLSAWFAPQYRGLAGIITVLLAAAALVLSNLGGFMIGTLLGVVGGALIFAWRPVPAEPPAETAEGTGPDTAHAGHAAHTPHTAHEDVSPGTGASGRQASDGTTLSSLASAFSVPQDGTAPPTGSPTNRKPGQD